MASLAAHGALAVELWTSWASMLRVYAAAHGLASSHHAVVEVSAETILLRVGSRWVRFTHTGCTTSGGRCEGFTLREDGTVTLGDRTDDLDLAAERVARELLQA